MRLLQLVILLLIFQNQADAQAPVLSPASSPDAAGFSAEHFRNADRIVKEYMDSAWIPGAAAIVVKNGRIAYHKEWGFQDAGKKIPMKKDGIFRIASQTKAITSVAVMILFDEGKLLLDDPISKYIPEFNTLQVIETFNLKDSSYTTVPAKNSLTIRHLLTHTSGIGYAQIGSPEANALYAKNGISAGIGTQGELLAPAMKKLAALPLFHEPGKKWTYGLNTDVLGYLVEVVSGTSLDDFFQKRIFTPLGMKDTYFNLPAEKQNRLVKLLKVDPDGKITENDNLTIQEQALDINYPNSNSSYYSGGAGLSSTLLDYAIFLQMLLNEGEYNGRRILGKNTVRMMTMNQIGDVNFGVNKFGLGFSVITEAGSAISPRQIGTFAWGGAFSTTYYVDPKEKLICLFFKQLWGDKHGELSDKFTSVVYSAMK